MADDASPPSREPPKWRGRLQAPLITGLAYAVVLALSIWLLVASPMGTAKSISYSDFLQLVRADQISEVVIAEHRIRGVTKGGGQPFETTRIEDPGQGAMAFERSRAKIYAEAARRRGAYTGVRSAARPAHGLGCAHPTIDGAGSHRGRRSAGAGRPAAYDRTSSRVTTVGRSLEWFVVGGRW